jgi:hypothetical protein
MDQEENRLEAILAEFNEINSNLRDLKSELQDANLTLNMIASMQH